MQFFFQFRFVASSVQKPTFDQLVFDYVLVARAAHQAARISLFNDKKYNWNNRWPLTNSYRMFIFSGPMACGECNGWQRVNQMWLALSVFMHVHCHNESIEKKNFERVMKCLVLSLRFFFSLFSSQKLCANEKSYVQRKKNIKCFFQFFLWFLSFSSFQTMYHER